MNIDFEKIRLEVVNDYLSSFSGDDKKSAIFFEIVANASSSLLNPFLPLFYQVWIQ